MKWLKKLTDSEQSVIKSILENDNGLKITAVVLAILMFITVNQIGNPIWKNYFGDTDYIEGIPLTVKYDTDKYVVSGIPQSINVNISGSENNVQTTLNEKENLVATLPLSYKSSGSFTISSDQVEFNNTSNVQITPATTSFEVNIQDKTSETRSVDIGYINGNERGQGIMLNQPNLEQKSVKISGGKTDVANVVSVRGQIDLNQLQESDTEENTETMQVDLVPYDKQGEVMSGVSIEPSTVSVDQTYTRGSVELPMKFVYDNDDNNYISAICKSTVKDCTGINKMNVNVYGERSKISELKDVTFRIDKDSFDGDTSTALISPNLESGIFVEKGSPTNIKLKTEAGIDKQFKDIDVQVLNLDKDLKLTETPKVDISVVGKKDVVSKLKEKDIKIAVDASTIKEEGTYDLKLQVTNAKNYNIKTDSDTISIAVEKEK